MKKKYLLININSHGEYGTERETRVSFFHFFFWGGGGGGVKKKKDFDLIIGIFFFFTSVSWVKKKIKN